MTTSEDYYKLLLQKLCKKVNVDSSASDSLKEYALSIENEMLEVEQLEKEAIEKEVRIMKLINKVMNQKALDEVINYYNIKK